MSSGNCSMVQFYWGIKIIYAGGSISHHPPVPKKVMFVTKKVGFDELVDIVYIMGLDWNSHKISLAFQNYLQNGVFGAIPLVDNNGVDGMWFLKDNSDHGIEIYVEVVPILAFSQDNTQNLHIGSPDEDWGPNIHGSE